jgi:spore germination protein
MGKRWLPSALICLLSLFVSGCWDMVEIDKRGFVIGVAVDVQKNEKTEEKAREEAPDKPEGKHRFVVTEQYVIPGALAQQGGSQGGGGGQGEAFLNLTSEGASMFEVSREMATRTSRSPFFQHLKLIIISEAIAKEKDAFAESLDYYLRDHELRRTSKVMIAKGEARKVIEVKPKNEKLPVMYIDSISENTKETARMLPEVSIGDIHEQLLSGMSFVLPRVTPDSSQIKMAGAAIIHGKSQKMVGFLGEEETEGLNFLTGNIKGGLLKIPVEDNLVVFEIQEATRTIQADVKNRDHMVFDISIEAEGDVIESFEQLDFLSGTVISDLEQKLAGEIERLAKDTVQKANKEFKTDFLRIGNYLNTEHNAAWNQVKNNWDFGRNYFAKSEIRVHAKVKIRSTGGVINKSERFVRG